MGSDKNSILERVSASVGRTYYEKQPELICDILYKVALNVLTTEMERVESRRNIKFSVMQIRLLFLLIFLITFFFFSVVAEELPDINIVPQELHVPLLMEGNPEPGKRVKVTLDSYRGTEVYHVLYLPTNWEAGRRYPVIAEYSGNGPYQNKYGDTCSGKVDDCMLGYGVSGGKGVIWVCLPFISEDHQHNQLQWWGDVQATVDYCKAVVALVCNQYGGDVDAVFLAGFSRGAIACNYIGLHDDDIASLWKGFICHSHYDGVREWNYAGSKRAAAVERLHRLNGRPQFISHEGSVAQTQQYLEENCLNGNFTFQAPSYHNHTSSWVLRDIPERAVLRAWFKNVLMKDEDRR